MNIHFIQHVSFEHPGCLLHWAQQQHNISFTRVFDEVKFPAFQQIDLLIVMGGPMCVYEEKKYGWLKIEKQFIKDCIKAGKKVLGICLGSQLVAEALGAKIYPHTEKEIGWWPVKKTEAENILLKNFPEELIVFHWHGDTFDLPPGASYLFFSAACKQQGFIYNNRVAGLQFHMEATEGLIDNMIEHEREELIAGNYVQTEEQIRQGIKKNVPVQNRYIKNFMEDFVKL